VALDHEDLEAPAPVAQQKHARGWKGGDGRHGWVDSGKG
jgi:hypothetical protein